MSDSDTTATNRVRPDASEPPEPTTDRSGATADRELETYTSPDVGEWPRTSLNLLVVSTFGGGGVHHYTDEQIERLDDVLSVSSYDMGMLSDRDGFLWQLRGVLVCLLAFLRFPFRSRPDIAHVHTSHRFSFYRASLYVLFAAHVWRTPVVLHVHGSSFDEFVDEATWPVARLQRAVFGAADDIVVLSDYWSDIVAKRADERKIRVVPNAVDSDTFLAGIESGHPHVVFVSNLFERKGVVELVEAIEVLSAEHDGHFQVSIAGDGPLSDRVEALAAEHDHVEYPGYVSEERKRLMLAEGSIYVLPTYAEGLPIAMLEGMASGNAIVSTTVGAIPEVIDDSRGILVDPGDVDGLVDAIETLLSSPQRRAEMGRNNRQAIERYYSWDRAVDELLAIYDSHD